MLALGWLLYAFFGVIFRSISPLITPIIADLHISYSQMGLILGSWQLASIGAAAFVGAALDKWGIRVSLFLGSLVMALSVGLRYFTTGFWSLLFVVAFLGVGAPLIAVGSAKIVALWFSGRDRGMAVGLSMTGPSIGGAFALAATNRFFMPVTGYNWRLTFALYGLMVLGVGLIWLLFAREAEAPVAAGRFEMGRVFMKLIKVRNVRVLLLSGLFAFSIHHGYTTWLPKMLEAQGLSPTAAGFAASIPLLAGIPSVSIIPRLVPPRWRARFIACMAVVIAMAVWPGGFHSRVFVYIGLALYGSSVSTLFPILILILMDTPEVGARYMGSAGGIYFSISEIGGFMGPLVVGALVEWTGSFHVSIFYVSALSLVIFILTFLLKDIGDPVPEPS